MFPLYVHELNKHTKYTNLVILTYNFVSSTLVQSLERCKRKSQARLRRLDSQMLGMVERHAAQVTYEYFVSFILGVIMKGMQVIKNNKI